MDSTPPTPQLSYLEDRQDRTGQERRREKRRREEKREEERIGDNDMDTWKRWAQNHRFHILLYSIILSCPILYYPLLFSLLLSSPLLSSSLLSCPVLSCPVLSCPLLSCPPPHISIGSYIFPYGFYTPNTPTLIFGGQTQGVRCT